MSAPERNPIMLVLIGEPYSGKSRFRKYVMSLPGVAARTFVVSSDDALARFAAKHEIPQERIFDHYAEVRALMQDDIDRAMLAGRDIIVDRTNLTPKARNEWMELARQHQYDAIGVIFKSPSDAERAQRISERGITSKQPQVPDLVLLRMALEYRKPLIHEGFAAIITEAEARGMFAAHEAANRPVDA